MIGKKVIVRCRDAGVHFGILKECCNQAVRLQNSRNLWAWSGANTLNEVATKGVNSSSKVSEPVEDALFLDAISIYALTDVAYESLSTCKWS